MAEEPWVVGDIRTAHDGEFVCQGKTIGHVGWRKPLRLTDRMLFSSDTFAEVMGWVEGNDGSGRDVAVRKDTSSMLGRSDRDGRRRESQSLLVITEELEPVLPIRNVGFQQLLDSEDVFFKGDDIHLLV